MNENRNCAGVCMATSWEGSEGSGSAPVSAPPLPGAPVMPWEAGPSGYGVETDEALRAASPLGLSREGFLKLAWAALDQACKREDMRDAAPAFEAIAKLLGK